MRSQYIYRYSKTSMRALLPLLLPLGGALQTPVSPVEAVAERRVAAMGTVLGIEVTANSRLDALRASEAALAAVEAAEQRLSTWRPDSELSQLCAAPVGVPFEASPLLARDLGRALFWHAETSGAFTPTARSLVEAWGLREGGREPSPEELKLALERSASDSMRFELPHVTRLIDGAGVEEGGFGKGVALDDAGAALLAAGASGAFLDFGGQTLLVGATSPTFTALAHPDDRTLGVLRLELEPGSSATSGNSERGIEVDGVRLGHVIDPRSGRPARDFGSLTVLASSATDADCLSTALYVLGPDEALRFAEARPGIDVVILERAEGHLRVQATSGLRGRLESLIPGLEVSWPSPPTATPSSPAPATGPHR
jgi:thiamine biosynthesis lipoprotein